MTHTYTNITLLDVEPDEAATWLADNDYTAAVSPQVDDITVIYENTLADHAADDEPLDALVTLASEISYELGCSAWLIIVDANAALIYTLYTDGEAIDSYGVRDGIPPDGGDPQILVNLFDAPKRQIKVVRNALNRQLDPTTETASARLEKVIEALEVPQMIAGYNYQRVTGGDTPPIFSPDDLLHVQPNDESDTGA
jgi:hypothetical protein